MTFEPQIWTKDSSWSEEHLKLLYLVSKYSHAAQSADEKERWIRKTPLLVLIYEAIVEKVLDYDYAPSSEIIDKRRIYLNITQEGKDDIDDMREAGLINGLKLSSASYQSVTAYQVSATGQEVLEKVETEWKQAIDALFDRDGEQLVASWTGEHFELVTPNGKHRQISSITDIEDVSYVSSPYLPAHLIVSETTLENNAHRAAVAATGLANIRDDLDEVIHLSDVKVMVGEWIPFGSNQIVSLNDKLGSADRVKGGLFTAVVDEHPAGTEFEVSPGLTSVQIIDYDLTTYLNFQAEVHYPESEGVVQIEHFGVHMKENGNVVYGLTVDAILDRVKDNISLDHLSRLLVDIHQDSSQITDSLISSYQRSLLSMVFMGDAANRDKFNLILAESISPKMEASRYMDKEAHENELKQVLGETHAAHNLSADDLLVIARHGVLMAGPNAKQHEAHLTSYLNVMAVDIFVRNFFNRTFVLSDTLKRTRRMINEYQKDPNSIPRIRNMLSDASKDVISLGELLLYLRESLEVFETPKKPKTVAGKKLHEILDIERRHRELMRRVTDLEKNITGARHELNGLREMTDVVSETQMFRLQEEMQANSKNLESVFRSNERASSSLEIMQVILSGTLAFEILDRLTGEWSVTETDWGKSWFVDPLINKPLVWFFLNLGMWALIAGGLIYFMRYLTKRSTGVLSTRFKANLAVKMEGLNRFIADKPIQEEDSDWEQSGELRRISWDESDENYWQGAPPQIEMLYDERNAYLLKVSFEVDKNGPYVDEKTLRKLFLDQLRAADAIA